MQNTLPLLVILILKFPGQIRAQVSTYPTKNPCNPNETPNGLTFGSKEGNTCYDCSDIIRNCLKCYPANDKEDKIYKENSGCIQCSSTFLFKPPTKEEAEEDASNWLKKYKITSNTNFTKTGPISSCRLTKEGWLSLVGVILLFLLFITCCVCCIVKIGKKKKKHEEYMYNSKAMLEHAESVQQHRDMNGHNMSMGLQDTQNRRMRSVIGTFSPNRQFAPQNQFVAIPGMNGAGISPRRQVVGVVGVPVVVQMPMVGPGNQALVQGQLTPLRTPRGGIVLQAPMSPMGGNVENTFYGM